MRIAFSTSNLLRKETLRISTTVYEKNGKMFVRKRALSKYGYPHLHRFIKAEEELRKSASGLNFVKVVRKLKSEIIYEYLDIPTITQLIEKALIGKEFDEVLKLVQSGFEAIDSVVSKDSNIYDSGEFVTLFDKAKIFDEGRIEGCLAIGVLDFKFDNLLKNSSGICLIDYEWIYNFPLPRAYVKFRAIYYLTLSLQLIIDTLCSEDFPCYRFQEHLLIPKAWFDLLNIDYKDLKRFLAYENSFQNFVNLVEQKIHLSSIKPVEEVVTSPQQEDLNSLSKENNKSANKKLIKIFMMEQQINKLNRELESKNHELESIKASKVFKLWRGYHKVKGGVTG